MPQEQVMQPDAVFEHVKVVHDLIMTSLRAAMVSDWPQDAKAQYLANCLAATVNLMWLFQHSITLRNSPNLRAILVDVMNIREAVMPFVESLGVDLRHLEGDFVEPPGNGSLN
jgi:hypothetical protein